jgi:small conductance mechanosensitive channel
VAGVLVIARHGIPLTGLVAPATIIGVAFGLGGQRIVQNVPAGFFIIAERQYGFGDLRVSTTGVAGDATGTVEDVNLRVTRLRSVDG